MISDLLPVIAASQPGGGGGGMADMMPTVIMFGAMILIFYFLIFRPQKKRQEEQKQLLDNLRKGDRVVLAAGIYGTVSELEEQIVTLQIADNVRIRVDKASVSQVINKG